MSGQPRSAARRLPPWARGAGLIAAVAAASTSVLLEPNARDAPAIAVLEVLVIVGFATAGFLLGQDPAQRSNGRLLIASAVLQVFTHLHLVDHSPLPMLAWLAGPLSAMPAAVVLLRFPAEQLDRLPNLWVRFHLTFLVVSRVTFTIPPPDRRLGWWPAIPMSSSTGATASVIGNSVLSASTLFFAGLLVRRLRSGHAAAARHELLPVLVAAISAAATIVLHLGSVATGRSSVPTLVLGIEQVGLLSVPAAFLFSAIVMRMARAAIGNLLLQGNSSTTWLELEHSLATTLSDPNLALLIPDPEHDRWVTVSGEPADPAPAGKLAAAVTEADGTTVAIVLTEPTAARYRAFLDAAVAAARLTLRNIAALDEVRDSRARITEAGYVERRRIERDLHDGAQQRLVAVGMSLDQVQHSDLDESTRKLAEGAADELREAMRELRDLARGTYPAVLTQRGLLPAVESTADRMRLDVDVTIPPHRWPPGVEATCYFLICEALTNVVKHAGRDRATVAVEDTGHALVVSIVDDGRGGATLNSGSGLVGLVDRVSAIGGTLEVRSPKGDGTCITAHLPYA